MAKRGPDPGETPRLRAQLLAWYDQHQRDLPWRRTRDPFCIWVSEIMLQQTRVAVVIDRYHAFLSRFPNVAALAQAPEDDVLALWSGLGYYRRARMLQKAAQYVVEHLSGIMPSNAEDLLSLPGIGAYTAAAVASIAHDQPVAVVDGNVERVLCRLAGWDGAAPGPGQSALRKRIDVLAADLLEPRRPGDFNQAMMELGATVCLPRNPQCLTCPLAFACKTRGEHKVTPRARMTSRDIACVLCLRSRPGHSAPQVLLQRRSASHTVMPGMWELPPLAEADVPEQDLRMTVRHAIMQVNYNVRVRSLPEEQAAALEPTTDERTWVSLPDLSRLPLTGLARKILTRARLFPAHRIPVPTAAD